MHHTEMFDMKKRMDGDNDLQLDPPDGLLFNKLAKDNKCSMSIINQTRKRILIHSISMNSDSPERYCLQPISGVIAPQDRLKVNVEMKKPACASQDDKSKQMETNDRIKIDYSYLDELDNILQRKTFTNNFVFDVFLSLLIIIPMILIVYLFFASIQIPTYMSSATGSGTSSSSS